MYFIHYAALSLCIQGTPPYRNPNAYYSRFIPVYTGNTQHCIKIFDRYAVYPCVYREHALGSCLYLAVSRFIPVCTGNTSGRFAAEFPISVYPCVYREHHRGYRPKYRSGGLSLCIQGTPNHQWVGLAEARFIPVYTGNTTGQLCTKSLYPVYPCVYREHIEV